MKSDLNALPYWSFLHIFEGVKFLLALNRTGKIRFSGTRKSVLLKATSGRYAPCNFVLAVTLGGTRLPHRVPCQASNEKDYGKINVETNSCTVVSTRRTSLTWRY